MKQILVDDWEVKSNLAPQRSYYCIDYTTLKKYKIYGSEILKSNDTILGLEDKKYIVESIVPNGSYSTDRYVIQISKSYISIIKDNKYGLVLQINKRGNLSIQSNEFLQDARNIRVSQFFVRPDDSLYLVCICGDIRVRLNINEEDRTTEVKIGESIFIIPLCNMSDFLVLLSGGV
jgi:hypothetical protein